MFAGLCPSVYLKRLKISWRQPRAGSSPFRSILNTQYFKDYHIVAVRSSHRVPTQILRTRLKLKCVETSFLNNLLQDNITYSLKEILQRFDPLRPLISEVTQDMK